MANNSMRKIISLIIICGALLAQHITAAEEPVERIAEPLQTLIKKFKHDPNTEAEIILHSTKIVIDENYLSHSVTYIAAYINSDEAVRDYSQISISFNSFYENIELEFANVRTLDGQMDSIKPDASQIQSPTDENFYHDRKELLFSLPNVRKGSVIEFQYRHTDTKKIIAKQWFDSFSLHWWEDRAANQGPRVDRVAAIELKITAPKKISIYNNDLSVFGVKQTRQELGDLQVLTWKGKDLPKVVLQDNMSRDHNRSAHLRMSTIGSWQQVADWADDLIAPHLITDSKLDALINSLAKTAITPEEKVKAVYRTLQEKVRYVFAHVGRGGYEPHNAFEVLSNGYGDCKDQTALAVTMLRKLGIKTDAALLVTRSRGIPIMSVTSVSFDHMIVHIPAQEGLAEMWLDSSGDTALFPGFSVGLEGQPALIVNSATQTIVTIPALKAEQHFAHFELTFDKFEDKNIEANFSMKFGGSFEQRLRGMWQFSRERDKTFRELMGHIYPAAEVIALNGNNADSMWQSFNVTGRFAFKNIWNGDKEKLSYGFNIIQLTNLFAGLRDLHKPQDRVQDYVNDPGYTISARLIFTRPSPEHIAALNGQGQNFDNLYFSLIQKSHEENGKFIVDITFVLKPFQVTPMKYPEFYTSINQLLDSSDWLISYHYDKGASELAALEQSTTKSDASVSAADFIALAKLQIKSGAYDKALNAANQAVIKAPKNSEAYYVLGLAQGYNNLLYESEKSFAKAEELGFKI
jgi:hypothetical protein